MKLNKTNPDFSHLLLLKKEQSSAKGNERIKLWLFSCEESKLIKLTSFLLYTLSVDAPGEQFPLWNRIRIGDGRCSFVTGYFLKQYLHLTSHKEYVSLFGM